MAVARQPSRGVPHLAPRFKENREDTEGLLIMNLPTEEIEHESTEQLCSQNRRKALRL